MRRYWITIGIIFTITAVLFGIGELVRIRRKEVLSDEVQEQLPSIQKSFDTESLESSYGTNNTVKVERSNLE